MLRLSPIVKSKCPNCEKGSVFASKGNILKFKGPEMHKNCSVCQYKFEREPGYFFGAMFISYALTIAQSMAVYFVTWSLGLDLSVDMIMILITITMVILLFPNFRASRIIWMYIFTRKTI